MTGEKGKVLGITAHIPKNESFPKSEALQTPQNRCSEPGTCIKLLKPNFQEEKEGAAIQYQV